MSTPGVELRWGYGFEERPRKREVFRPFVREAIELAQEGMDDLGLEFSDRKYVVVDQAESPKDVWRGNADGKTCRLILSTGEVRRRKVDTVWLAAFLFHEFVHLVNHEYTNGRGMLDHAAAEGIAHVAEYDFVNELLYQNGRIGPPVRYIERIRSLPKRELSKLETEFWKASAKPVADEYENIEKWFHKFSRQPVNFPRGAVVGIAAVSRQIERGWEIPDLITMAPYDVLDVA